MMMTETEFEFSSPRYFMLRLQGMRTAQATMEESRYKYSWEQARFIAYYAAAGHLKKGTRMQQLMKFPWEQQEINWAEKIKEFHADKRFKKHLN